MGLGQNKDTGMQMPEVMLESKLMNTKTTGRREHNMTDWNEW